MNRMTVFTVALLALMAAGSAWAQDAESKSLRDMERAVEEAENEAALAEAEAQLAEAAARVAELSTRNLPDVAMLTEKAMKGLGRPRLGVTIDHDDPDAGPVEGVTIISVTPGSAAAEAGLRSGDVLTSVSGMDLEADQQRTANKRLFKIMSDVEAGDKLEIEYLRKGNIGSVTVEPRVVSTISVALAGIPEAMSEIGQVPMAINAYKSYFGSSGWGDLELVELNEGLGRYFGTDEGLLVVRAPRSSALSVEDGDVIQTIDGRKPTSVSHAIRILASYAPGEALKLGIMRDKRRQTLDVEIPDNRSSFVLPPHPPAAPLPPAAPRPAKPVDGRHVVVSARTHAKATGD